MKGAIADPCVSTMRAPNSTSTRMIGPSHHFLRTRMKAQISPRRDGTPELATDRSLFRSATALSRARHRLVLVHHVGHHGADELVRLVRHPPGHAAVYSRAPRRLARMLLRIAHGGGEVGSKGVDDTRLRLRPRDSHVDRVGILLAVEAPALAAHEVVHVVDVEGVRREAEQERRPTEQAKLGM